MALLEMRFRSNALNMNVAANVILPDVKEGETYKTLYLLHGLSDDHSAWERKSCIELYAKNYGIAVVMPCGGRSWYTDTAYGAKYFTYITEELPAICRRYFKGMSDKREDNMIAGLSMGGYGALKAALTYPDKYCACASLSGALDVTRKYRPTNLDEWRSIFGFDIESPAELLGSKHDVFAIARRNAEGGIEFPKMYLWCGTEDSLLQISRDFHVLMNELGVPHGYEESEGDHSWKWWDMHIQSALKYLMGDK